MILILLSALRGPRRAVRGFLCAFLAAAIYMAPVQAQVQDPKTQTVTIQLKEAPVTALFHAIEKQTTFRFLYDKSLETTGKKLTVNYKNIAVAKLLQDIGERTGLQFRTSGQNISVATKDLPPAANLSAGGKREITGVVVDSAGQPMVGVTVAIKGTRLGTGTDGNGKFILSVDDNAVLVFSLMGFRKQEIPVQQKDKIDVVLEEASSALEEVVVVGFGEQKKISLVGAQATITPKELKQPVSNLTQSLGGRVAGMVSVQRSGELGYNDANIYIRGISTFTQGFSAPLTLVDGVPRSISNVDPEDIESFSVLKDASATAVYGVRGANGVILITTKSGKPGKPAYNLRYTEGITQFSKLPSFADGPTYMKLSNEALTTRGSTPVYSDEAIQKTADGSDPYLYPNVDWFKELFRNNGKVRNANANISGGSEKSVYYIGLGYYDELGMYKTDELTKYNSRLFAEQVIPKLKPLFSEWEHRWWPQPMAATQRATIPAYTPGLAAE